MHKFDHRLSKEKYVARHAARLAELGLLQRNWIILGAAPDPNLPQQLLHSHARVDINNAGKTALALGLGRADLTIRSQKKSWAEHDRVDTSAMVWIRKRCFPFPRLFLLGKPYTHIGPLWTLTKADRNVIVQEVSGVSPSDIGDYGKVTNGIVGACYGLFLGVPKVVLAGISLTKTGHSYDQLGRHRIQVEEDTYVLRSLVHTGRVETTEPDLHEMTGIPLWKPFAG